jgi:hypothetical protein
VDVARAFDALRPFERSQVLQRHVSLTVLGGQNAKAIRRRDHNLFWYVHILRAIASAVSRLVSGGLSSRVRYKSGLHCVL